jgi:hypothetical protein
MKTYNIKSDLPSVALAKDRVEMILKYEREKVIKIIHGYGSTGLGGDIKTHLHQWLTQKMMQHQIKAFIPGDAFGHLLGYDQTIKTYIHLLKKDPDGLRPNEGITYVIL